MAKEKDKSDLPPSFEIYSAHPGYEGVHPCKLRFTAGMARTADAKVAAGCAQIGLAVFDVSDEAEAKAAKAYAAQRGMK